jgi:molecular chaperone GrpE
MSVRNLVLLLREGNHRWLGARASTRSLLSSRAGTTRPWWSRAFATTTTPTDTDSQPETKMPKPTTTSAEETAPKATPAEKNPPYAKDTHATAGLEPQTPVKEIEAKLAELEDKYRRLLAETENIRERARRELQHVRNFAIQDFSKQLLDVADILRMALTSIPEPIVKQLSGVAQRSAAGGATEGPREHIHYLQELYQGVELTERELLRIFRKNGVEVIDPHHKNFDPDAHHALYEVVDTSLDPGRVAVVVKKGYSLHGRTLRPAQVGVVKNS